MNDQLKYFLPYPHSPPSPLATPMPLTTPLCARYNSPEKIFAILPRVGNGKAEL